MKTFQSLIFLLLSFLSFAFASEQAYDTTVYLTNTVTQVYTVRKTGTPTGTAANVTSTIMATTIPTMAPSAPSVGTILPYPSLNGTETPSVTRAAPSATYTGAASGFKVNALVAALAVGVGYLAL
ncbi:hypothetical protein GQ43DRAFT_434659 [Delitschia confertaspora ATCC 74209]|uniref:Uncharacterized protein n=1 Tax=Delitschia confertaspora ATCC 74209 TaxID=1513339 RepID=A0A9P4JEL0_9PLEO|nr:hypothetical protein GQ43DRAFT_434659 [Delitschia confertaspora ATCC 74209]